MTVNLSPVGGAAAQFFDNSGNPLTGGKIYTYAAGTTTPAVTYTSAAGVTAHTNPIILDSAGRVPSGEIWISNGVTYKFVIKNANDVLIGTYDNIPPGVSGTAADITYTPAGTGAVTTTVQAKLRQYVSSSDFPDLATAIASFGSTNTYLVINSPVTVSDDLTIPANVEVCVENPGIITVATGKRLYINGSFSAPRLHRCFNAPLLSTTVTASVSNLLLIVTAVSNPVLASGQVVTGGGLEPGVTIAQGWTGGTGTYTLNGDWGTIASTTFTVTGASVIFGAGVVDKVYPQWFGAVADAGTTDNTSAIRHAVYCQQWGGTVGIPAGSYKVTGSTVLHGGMTIEGDGVVNISNGSPPPNETAVPSYVWVNTDNTEIWVIPVRADRITIRSLSHGAAAATSGTAPIGTNRRGVLFNGRAPQFVYAPVIDNCYFFNLDRGIFVNDSYAATETNWGVNPGLVVNCQFMYCSYGILIYTDNCDAWKIDQCVFILPVNSSGVHLVRCGFLKLDTCFAYGGSVANSEFIKIAPIETGNPLDTVTIDNCQAEECSHFLTYDGPNTRAFDINVRNCIPQLGADIYLGNLCNYNSLNNHYMAYVYYDNANVKINSIDDWFEFLDFSSGTTWDFINAGAGSVQAIQTYIPGAFPSSGLGPNARFTASAINSVPNVQTVDNYNITPADVTVVIDRATATTVVIPSGFSYPGRRIRVVTRQAFAVLSSQSNIVPITGGSATNAILPATAGKWVDLESTGGTNWIITASN